MSYKVVEEFEQALSIYTGAPYVVTTNSCSMALLIACDYYAHTFMRVTVSIPKKTYCSVPQSVIHAGHSIKFDDREWTGAYRLNPLPVWDSARRFYAGMYSRFNHYMNKYRIETDTWEKAKGEMACVSFQTSKILGLEQGGAILHDNAEADKWLRRARFDGRLDASEKLPKQIGFHCYMNPSTAALGIQRLACLPKHNEDQVVEFSDLSGLDIWN